LSIQIPEIRNDQERVAKKIWTKGRIAGPDFSWEQYNVMWIYQSKALQWPAGVTLSWRYWWLNNLFCCIHRSRLPMLFSGPDNPQNCPFSRGISTPSKTWFQHYKFNHTTLLFLWCGCGIGVVCSVFVRVLAPVCHHTFCPFVSQHPKRHLDRLSHFCTAHPCAQIHEDRHTNTQTTLRATFGRKQRPCR